MTTIYPASEPFWLTIHETYAYCKHHYCLQKFFNITWFIIIFYPLYFVKVLKTVYLNWVKFDTVDSIHPPFECSDRFWPIFTPNIHLVSTSGIHIVPPVMVNALKHSLGEDIHNMKLQYSVTIFFLLSLT